MCSVQVVRVEGYGAKLRVQDLALDGMGISCSSHGLSVAERLQCW